MFMMKRESRLEVTSYNKLKSHHELVVLVGTNDEQLGDYIVIDMSRQPDALFKAHCITKCTLFRKSLYPK